MEVWKNGIRWFETIRAGDAPLVGNKNASLGEMRCFLGPQGVRVPDGFATTTDAYWAFISADNLRDNIEAYLFEYQTGGATLEETGRAIRRLFSHITLPVFLAENLRAAYRELSRRYGVDEVDVAVRSSATVEDSPEASFAGQQETFLNVVGEGELLEACRKCYASLFTDRAIAYREEHGVDHLKVALSIGVQKMVRSDKAGSGVMFTLDTESGCPDIVLINAGWGLGENIVQGIINPDQYEVFKPLLAQPGCVPILSKKQGTKDKKMVYGYGDSRYTENVRTPIAEQRRYVLDGDEILQLARWGVAIEAHYGCPMDIEWAKDGDTGDLFIVQARPETIHARRPAGALKTYRLREAGRPLVTGHSIGSAVARGRVCHVLDAHDLRYVESGAIIVTAMTEPDWVPAMRRAAGIITDYGGRTCHAAIVSRELGIPAIVGTGDGTLVLRDGQPVTLSCAAGEEGTVYEGFLDYDVSAIDLDDVPETKTQVMLTLASPEGALKWWRLPVDGIGLVRMEFIISHHLKIHPMAVVHFERLQDERARRRIRKLTRGYANKEEYFVSHLARALAKIAASQYPRPVLIRTSDVTSSVFTRLVGGEAFEPREENPALGWRGAARYYSDKYRDGFALECRAIRKAREELGLTNITVMIPFCRTPEEADRVLAVMAEHGLRRGEHGLEVHMMCEVPANIVLAEAFAERFDGFSIGSNDLTQLILGVDRHSAEMAYLFDERHAAVRRVMEDFITRVHRMGRQVGFCGQVPSDDPDYAALLVGMQIDALSLNPDSVIAVRQRVAEAERLLAAGAAAAAVAAPVVAGELEAVPVALPE